MYRKLSVYDRSSFYTTICESQKILHIFDEAGQTKTVTARTRTVTKLFDGGKKNEKLFDSMCCQQM